MALNLEFDLLGKHKISDQSCMPPARNMQDLSMLGVPGRHQVYSADNEVGAMILQALLGHNELDRWIGI
jgi:hypothetical protein